MTLLKTVLSKAFALGLLAVVIAGFVIGIVQPLTRRLTAAEESIAQQRSLLGRLTNSTQATAADAAQAPAIQTTAADVFLKGDSDAGRIAGLQSRVDAIAQQAGARLSSTQVVAPRDTGGLRLLGIETQFSANLDQLQRILFELETQKPYLLIESLHVTQAADSETIDRPALDIRIGVAGAAERKKG
jgi:hypothetical protein